MLDQTLTAHALTKDALEIKVNYLQDSLSTQEIKYHITKTGRYILDSIKEVK